MTPLEYDFLRKSLKERSGLVLSADKQYLVESRLLPIARKAGFAGLGELVMALRRGDESLMMTVVEAMTTNETFFFRDRAPFENFRTAILPSLLAARRTSRHIRIWSAAASTGQEPYSLAMALRELGDVLDGWRIEIVATDLSGSVLQKAEAGIYSQFEVQRGLPIALLIKYFTKTGDMWQIAPELRAMVKFRQFNLLSDFCGARLIRSDLLPQRADLFRPGDQDQCAQSARPDCGRRQLSDSRRCRDRGRTDREFSHIAGLAWRLCAECALAVAADGGRGEGGSASGCRRRWALIRPALLPGEGTNSASVDAKRAWTQRNPSGFAQQNPSRPSAKQKTPAARPGFDFSVPPDQAEILASSALGSRST